jgi:predicted unusual protein kinase regulating ubiquinone biosynthesis (AarF/ABC1/UbiB family)
MRVALAGWLAREAPATEAARMEKFVHGLFGDDIARERAEHEAMVIKAREKLKTIPPASRPPSSRAQTDRGVGATSVPSPAPDGSTLIPGGEGSAALATRIEDPVDRGDPSGETIDGRYIVRELIGEGGMGRVYLAKHLDIGKKVALKILHPVYTRSPDVVARFRREARAASKIGHPNIVDVTDSGTTPGGSVYFVMEYLDGVELADVIAREGAMDATRALGIGTQMCRALAAAHNAGIIHRDLKPENVFLVVREGTTDFVKILDFGIAKSAELEEQRKERLTHPGMAMGTPEYMAPEQAAGRPADARSDV